MASVGSNYAPPEEQHRGAPVWPGFTASRDSSREPTVLEEDDSSSWFPSCCMVDSGQALDFVGPGQGDYVKETRYRYAPGSGEYTARAVKSPMDWRPLLPPLACLSALALILLGAHLLASRPRRAGADAFDCSLNGIEWWSVWGSEQRTWCCNHQEIGCSMPPPVSPQEEAVWTTRVPSPSAQEAFPPAPASNTQEGADAALSVPLDPQPAFMPYVDPAPWSGMLSTALTSSPPASTTSKARHSSGPRHAEVEPAYGPFDCDLDWDTWRDDWSILKQQECCRKVGRGCTDAT
jgi:hypothetical protein